jgi:predicted nucleotidyltransferase
MGLKIELERLFGCEVDLVLGGNIRNPYFREELEETKVPVYAA